MLGAFKIIAVILAVALGFIAWLLGGWLILPLAGLLVGLNAFGLRAKLAGRMPAVSRLRPLHLGLLVGVGGLFLWGVSVVLLSQASSSNRTAVAPAVTAVPTGTTVTVAAAPTIAPPTAVPPTNTAVPPTQTAVPAPTAAQTIAPTIPPTPVSVDPPAAAKPQMSSDLQAYLNYMQPKIQLAGQTLVRLGEQSTRLSNTPALLSDQTWRTQTAVVLGLMKNTGEEMQKYEPVPKELESLDDTMVSLGKDLVYIADEYATGLDGPNAARIRNATTRMQGIGPKTSLATTQIQQLLRGQ
jgi:hypothetical protein